MIVRFLIASVVAWLAVTCAAATAEEVEAPECDVRSSNISGFAPVEVTVKPAPRYPKEALNSLNEGWVLLEYAITPHGEPNRIEVIDAIGAKAFVDAAVRTISTWRYKPATRKGRAVEQSLYQTSILFLFEDSGRAADHRTFVRRYNLARSQLRSKNADAAIQTMETAFKGGMNLYEAAMGSFLLALAYRDKADWERALFHSRHSVIEGGRYLEYQTKGPAFALLVELEARTGNFREAVCGLERLRKVAPERASTDQDFGKTIAAIDAAMKDQKPLAVPGRLATHPLIEAPAVWRHRLLRRKFWFADVVGELKSFRLACVATAHEAPFDPEMLWTVPDEAGDCILRVEGAPGATFKLVEEW